MDTQSLFNKSEFKNEADAKKYIAAGNDIDDKPLTFGLPQSENNILKFGNSGERFKWISEGSVDIAFISSIDFACLKGGWKVLPKICKSTKGPSKRAVLFFNKNLTDINTIAMSENDRTSEIVLKIILKERHQIETNFEKTSGKLNDRLKQCDAVLLTGDQAIRETENNPFFIDLGEEWFDLTGLPLVYGFWIGNELTTQKSDFSGILNAIQTGSKRLEQISKKLSGSDDKYILDYLSSTVNYNFGADEQAGLNELYRFAFFYGFVDYIPDFHFMEI